MPIQYSPDDTNCWPKATYRAELLQVQDKTSKMKPDGSGGNPMQEWKVKVHRGDGATQLISDYFTPPGGTFKLQQLAKALGKEAEFKAGTFQADEHEGAVFNVVLDIEESDEFGDKNKIKKYLSADATPARPSIPARPQRQPAMANPIPETGGIPADDIPF